MISLHLKLTNRAKCTTISCFTRERNDNIWNWCVQRNPIELILCSNMKWNNNSKYDVENEFTTSTNVE